MDDTQPSVPSEPSTPPPAEAPQVFEPTGTQQTDHAASSVMKKAMLSTLMVVLVLGGFFLYDPFHLFRYNVGVSQDKAAEPSTTVTPTATPTPRMSATCNARGGIDVKWAAVPGAVLNGVSRSIGSAPYTIVFLEAKESGFSQYSYTDAQVQTGVAYHYKVFTGVPGSEPMIGTATCQ